MSIEEKIIKYLDNQLTPEERIIFEKELSNSIELKNEFGKFRSVQLKINDLKQIDTGSLYFSSLIPRFREKLKKDSGKVAQKKIAYALSIIMITAFSYLVYYSVFDSFNGKYNLTEFAESLSNSEKMELLDELEVTYDEISGDYYSDLSAGQYEFSLQESLFDTEDKKQLVELFDIEITDPAELIPYQKFEKIYNELLTMNFFEEK